MMLEELSLLINMVLLANIGDKFEWVRNRGEEMENNEELAYVV